VGGDPAHAAAVKHFVVEMVNRPGELAHLARALAARGINISHIAAGGAGRTAFANLETDKFEETRRVLSGMGYDFLAGDTLVVEVEDEPGAFARLTGELAEAGVNIEGVMTASRCRGKVDIAITVDDVEKAEAVLGREKVLAR
jgi:hypothetical protein